MKKSRAEKVVETGTMDAGQKYRPKIGPKFGIDAFFYLGKMITWVLFPLLNRFRVSGRSHIPLDTGVLFASNHQSNLDPVYVGSAARRRLGYLARKTLFKKKLGFFTLIIRSLGAIPMTRDSGKEGVRLAVEHLNRKEHILMFPEGTRTRDGSIGSMQPGVKLIAQKASVPVIPTAIHGLYEMWPRSKTLPRISGSVSIAFGEPIQPEKMKEMKAREFCDYLRERIVELYEKLDIEHKRRSSFF